MCLCPHCHRKAVYSEDRAKDGVFYSVEVCSHCGNWTCNMIGLPNAAQREAKSG